MSRGPRVCVVQRDRGALALLLVAPEPGSQWCRVEVVSDGRYSGALLNRREALDLMAVLQTFVNEARE